MADREIAVIRGKLYWAKVIGDPVPNYNKDGYEWTFDVALDEAGVKQAKSIKALNIKDKDDERGKFLTFKQKEVRASGDKNDPIRIVDANGNRWGDEKLGNGTVADVKFEVRDYGKGKYPGIYPRAIRVLEHVKYESEEFAPLSEDDEFFSNAVEGEREYSMSPDEDKRFRETFTPNADDLDDDLP